MAAKPLKKVEKKFVVNVWELRRLVIMSNGLIRDSLNFMMCPKFQLVKDLDCR